MHNQQILIDLGNSRLKWCFLNDIQDVSVLTHEQIAKASWGRLLDILHQAKSVSIANVASLSVLQPVLDICLPHQGLQVYQLESQAYQCGVTNAYQKPSDLGIDRWLALLAAHESYPNESVLIVDCGSAVTLDIVDASGLHHGGCIVLGLRNMAQCLYEKTALPETNQVILGEELLGHSTADCIQNGAIASIVGMIQMMSERYAKENPLRCVLTGSDALIVQPYLSIPSELQRDLVMRGMLLVEQDS